MSLSLYDAAELEEGMQVRVEDGRVGIVDHVYAYRECSDRNPNCRCHGVLEYVHVRLRFPDGTEETCYPTYIIEVLPT